MPPPWNLPSDHFFMLFFSGYPNGMSNYCLLTDQDKVLIRALRKEKYLSLYQILEEYTNREWKKKTVQKFLKKLRETGSIERRPGSGRPKSARTEENINAVEQLILSQEGKPGTSCSECQVAKRTGISHSSVRRLIKKDLNLKSLKEWLFKNCPRQLGRNI